MSFDDKIKYTNINRVTMQNKKHKLSINQNVLIKIKDFEINSLDYEKAIILDKRNFIINYCYNKNLIKF